MNKPAVTKIITDPDKNIQVVKTDLYNNDLNNIKDVEIEVDLEEDQNDIDKNTFIDKNTYIDCICKYCDNLFWLNFIFILISGIIIGIVTGLYNPDLDKFFWINQLIKYLLISIIQYIMALLVVYKNAKVNYTRKVIHISYFLIPQLLDIILIKYKKNLYTECWNIWIILLLLILLSEKIRKKISIINTMFKAVDRPEDRPYTLIWFSTQIIATLVIVIPFGIYFSHKNRVGLIFIPILINGLADGLAEPIGIRFGKHKYKTRACLSNRKYERSYEGSFCVFIVSFIIIASYYKYINLYQYIFCLLTIPILITFTEAFSPHTWDSPCIFFVVCSLLCISLFI